MFGKNKASLEEAQAMRENIEQSNEYLSSLESQKPIVDATITEITGSRQQMEADLRQVQENEKRVFEYASSNLDVTAQLSHSMEELQSELQKNESNCEQLKNEIASQLKEMQEMVEENKHLTSPSKYLSEFPGVLKNRNKEYQQMMSQMADASKQMGVLALNAAIEAGRIGESGKQFVSAAEDIRSQSVQYDVLIQNMTEQLNASEQKITELEEQIHHLVGILRDSNVAAARVMKGCMETDRKAQKVLGETFSPTVSKMREDVIGLKNSQEEILKTQERNQIQMEDIAEEVNTQKIRTEELKDTVLPALDKAASLKMELTREG